MITSLYMNQSAVVRIGEEITEKCTIGRGVRQGCLLSPVLFNIYGEMLIQEALQDQDGGVEIGGRTVKSVHRGSLWYENKREEDQSDEDVEIKQRRNKHSHKRKTTRGSQTV